VAIARLQIHELLAPPHLDSYWNRAFKFLPLDCRNDSAAICERARRHMFGWRKTRMGTQALLIEILISGFFAIACFRARADSYGSSGLVPQRLFMLTDRLERLKSSRWQWFAMVLLLFVLRKQMGAPMVAEFTALAQFLVFLALPTAKQTHRTMLHR
jgi:hypothetical protein